MARHSARPFDIQWARDVVRQCKAAGTAVFVKQLGAVVHAADFQSFPAPTTLSTRDHRIFLKDRKGADMSEWPCDLRVREFPREVATR